MKSRIIVDAEGLGKAVRASLEKRTCVQKKVQGAVKVHQTGVSRVVTGDIKRFTTKVERVCKYAGVDPEPFLAPPATAPESLSRLAKAAASGDAGREVVVGQILALLSKLR